jgi:site-specific DNA recombinase
LDYENQRAGKEIGEPAIWRSTNLIKALRSPSLLGHVVIHKDEDGKPLPVPVSLRDVDGSPFLRAGPIIDRVTFDRLQQSLNEMNNRKGPYRKSNALLLRILFCGVCGQAMYLRTGKGDRKFYACVSSSLGRSCGNATARQEVADSQVLQYIDGYGHIDPGQRIYDPGEDKSGELAELDAEMADAAKYVGTPAFRSGPAKDALDERLAAMAARREELASAEYRPGMHRWVPTGRTLRQTWDGFDQIGRNEFLRNLGIKIRYYPDRTFSWDTSFSVGMRMFGQARDGVIWEDRELTG